LIYLGFFLIYLGGPIRGGTFQGAAFGPFLILMGNLVVNRHEEAYLGARFADRNADYKARVRRWV
jgi:protein-S-isoprenylcysteine O-methyltransferase Ste14